MSIELVTNALGWTIVLQIALLLFWFVMMTSAKNWMYKIMRYWFPLTDEQFAHAHYALIGVYKVVMIVFFLMPYIALRIVG